MREGEEREANLGTLAVLAWLADMLASLIAVAVARALS
jgi:hypothetical protein